MTRNSTWILAMEDDWSGYNCCRNTLATSLPCYRYGVRCGVRVYGCYYMRLRVGTTSTRTRCTSTRTARSRFSTGASGFRAVTYAPGMRNEPRRPTGLSTTDPQTLRRAETCRGQGSACRTRRPFSGQSVLDLGVRARAQAREPVDRGRFQHIRYVRVLFVKGKSSSSNSANARESTRVREQDGVNKPQDQHRLTSRAHSIPVVRNDR